MFLIYNIPCNRPGKKKDNKFFAPIALLTQNLVGEVLGNNENSVLERLILAAKIVRIYGAGNCMLQSFVALDEFLKKFIVSGFATSESCIPISIRTTKDHAFLLIDKKLVCDPWANYVGGFDSSYWHEMTEEYFGIDSDWSCSHDGYYDAESTQFTYSFFTDEANQIEIDEQIKNNPPPSIHR